MKYPIALDGTSTKFPTKRPLVRLPKIVEKVVLKFMFHYLSAAKFRNHNIKLKHFIRTELEQEIGCKQGLL